jgi:hypothetical protein
MSGLSLLNQITLRTLTDPNYITKGSEVSWEEEDNNFIILADAIRELSNVNVNGIDPYDPAVEYSSSGPRYVTYGGNTWEYINPTPQTGITPGTDGTVWKIASQGLFSHKQNTDLKLAEGTSDEVTAAEIRAFIDAGTIGGVWGLISGTITDQTDLINLLDTKFNKDGSVAMTGHANWGGKNITNFGTLYSGNTNVIQNSTNANNYLQVASAGVVLNSNGEVTVQATALNVNTGSNKGQFKTDNLTSDRVYQFPDYDFAFPTSAPGSNTYLKWNGSSYVWATASGTTTLAALTDVNLTSVANGDLLKYDSGTSKWINFAPSYLTANQTITLSGHVTGSGSTSISTTIANGVVTNAMLAGSIAYSKLSLTGSILNADLAGGIDLTTKVTGLLPDGNIASAATWNAKQNALTFDSTPTASSSNPVTSDGIKTYTDKKSRIKAIIFG